MSGDSPRLARSAVDRGPTFTGLVGEAYDQIRQNAGANVAVLARLLWSLDTLADLTSMATRRRVLLEHARALEELADRSIPAPSDRQYIKSWSARLVASLDSSKRRAGDDLTSLS